MRLTRPAAICAAIVSSTLAARPFRIEVVDKENGWPVPLVELSTTNDQKFVTDNAGVVAFDAPENMDRETWIGVFSHGYEIKADGFGNRGVRVTPKPGGKTRIEIERKQIAKRLGRLTGAGIFAESQKLGEFATWMESGVCGSDTVQTATHDGKLFWLWGDTNLPHYPLGIFDTPVATSSLKPLAALKPPTSIVYDYVRNEKGIPRGTITIPGPGPVWLSGFVSLPDRNGEDHLVATYSKIPGGDMKPGELGLAEWNDKTSRFDVVSTFWKHSAAETDPPKLFPDGHPAIAKDAQGKSWLYLNGPPNFKCPATYEAWKNRTQWQQVERPKSFKTADGADIEVASASIAWSDFRKRWIMILQQKFGKPSVFGEVWYIEGKSPEGPWGPAVKVATHQNYTFYNVQIDWQLTDPAEPILLFEGTYTHSFTNNKIKTPRYDYNQILYRLDLNDPALKPAQTDL